MVKECNHHSNKNNFIKALQNDVTVPDGKYSTIKRRRRPQTDW